MKICFVNQWKFPNHWRGNKFEFCFQKNISGKFLIITLFYFTFEAAL
jgi:hypothetical protein